MSNRIYNTNLTRVARATDVEYPQGESLTVPDMALSLRELVDRYTRGQEVPQFRPGYADEDDDMYYPDPREMDISEIDDMRDRLNARARELRRKDGVNNPTPSKEQTPAEGGKPQESDEAGQAELDQGA